MKKAIEIILTQRSLDNAIKQLEKEKKELNKKIDEFVQKMAEQGVSIAIRKINELRAVESGELAESMQLKKGEAIQHGSIWYVYTDCEHAPFVEFGTGFKGQTSPHSEAKNFGWNYDTHNHGTEGWYYFDDDEGRVRWTMGMPHRPFMYETTNELRTIIKKTAKGVFG